MPEYYRDTGFEKVALVSGTASAGTVIGAPAEGKSVYLLGILSSGAGILKQGDNNGSIIMYVPAGNSDLSATIKVPNNSGVYSSNGNISIIHYVE